MSLDASVLAAQREMLEARAKTLRAELDQALHDPTARETLGLPDRRAETDDEAVADLQAEIDAASVERDSRELREVEEALHRVEQGEYGTCVDCEEEIPLARLQAQPHAKRCIRCEEIFEKRTQRPPGSL